MDNTETSKLKKATCTTKDPPVNLVCDTNGDVNILIGSSLAIRIRDNYLTMLFINKDDIVKRLSKVEATAILSDFIHKHNKLLDCVSRLEEALSYK